MNCRACLLAATLSLAGSAAMAERSTWRSKYGSYLDALVQFGTITGLDPFLLGANEQGAADLGISAADALTLERVASQELAIAAVREPGTWALFAGSLLRVGRWAGRLRGSPGRR